MSIKLVRVLISLYLLALLTFVNFTNVNGLAKEELEVTSDSIKAVETSSDSDNKEVKVLENEVMYINAFNVNFRLEPSTSSLILDKLNYQDKLIIIDKYDESWFRVEYNDTVGYVSSDYVQYDYPEFPIYKVVVDSGIEYKLDEKLQYFTYELCRDYDIEEYYELILVQMFVESRYNSNLISSTNDYGLMQINVCNHNKLSRELGIVDFLDPKSSIRAGVHMMSEYLKKYDVDSALSKYNTGKAYDSTKYSDRVNSYMDNLVRL